MISSTLSKIPKSRVDSEYGSEEEPKAAAVNEEAAHAATSKAPRKAKKTTSDSLIEQLVQTLTANQSHTQQSRPERLELTELVQGLGKTEDNAPKLKKLTKESNIKFVDFYDGCDQSFFFENQLN